MSPPRLRATLVVSAGVFLAIAALALSLDPPAVEVAVREALLGLAAPPLRDAFRLVNRAGDWTVLAPGLGLLLVVSRRARAHWWLWVALMVAAPLAEGTVKLAIGRARPEDLSLGFPSGHATAAAAFFGAVSYLAGPLPSGQRRAVRAAAALAILLVALARVVLGAHWPSDVLGGIALGLALATAAALLDRGLAPTTPERRARAR